MAQTGTADEYTVIASPATVAPGGTITISWHAPSTHRTNDWIGLFLAGLPSAGNTKLAVKYVPAGTSGSMTFTAPYTEIPRTYQFRYLLNGGYVTTASSNPVRVTRAVASQAPPSPPAPSQGTTPPPVPAIPPPPSSSPPPPPASPAAYMLNVSPLTVAPGGSITVSWHAPSTHRTNDWIGLFLAGLPSAGNTKLAVKYVPAGTSGTITFTAPNTIVRQTYQLRYLLNGGYSEAARSPVITVTRAAGSTPTPTPPTSPPPSPPIVTAPKPTPVSPAAPTPPSPPSPTPPSPPVTSGLCSDGKQVAFAGAEGFGRCAQGGRGGRVIEVTNLNDSGAGSLRHCAEVESGPRTCVFRVSGTIDLNTSIEVTNPYLTIAGQTAPGSGIALKDGGLAVKANHVIVRHLRVRPGLAQLVKTGQNVNGIMIQSNEGVAVHDIILDHCSVSWGSDDLIYVVYGSDNVTVQWSIISEALSCNQCGGKGLLLDAKSVTVHHSLYAHIYIRWPQISKGNLDFVNNVKYNGNGTDAQIGAFYGPILMNAVGNYAKDGPNANPRNLTYAEIRTKGGLAYSASSGIFVDDNIGRYWDGHGGIRHGLATPPSAIIWGDDGGIPVQSQRYPFPSVTTTSAQQAYHDVLNQVGALPRDSADARVIADVRNGTGRWPEDPLQVGGWPLLASTEPPVDTDHDGMPDDWELSHGLNPANASDGPTDANHDGFTNLEEYLHSLTSPAS
jgi:pectate lyase